jgi:hypothetical protein
LSINNPVRVLGVAEDDLPDALQGLALEGVVETELSVILRFGGGVTLEVDLSDDAYCSPEAMVLIKPDGGCVVWN